MCTITANLKVRVVRRGQHIRYLVGVYMEVKRVHKNALCNNDFVQRADNKCVQELRRGTKIYAIQFRVRITGTQRQS